MKRIILCLIIVILTHCGYTQSNVYFPLPNSNAGWRENSGGNESMDCKDYKDILIGDSLINGLIYHKIQRSGVHYWDAPLMGCSNNIWFHFNNYQGAYRNDSINKKVYYVQPGSSSELLLYDFNLCLNCQLPATCIYSPTNNYFIGYTDSTLIGNQYRKRYGIFSQNSSFPFVGNLIEGIGSTLGLLDRIEQPFEHYTELQCFELNGTTVYSKLDTTTCWTIVGIEQNIERKIDIKIIPNPVYDEAKIILRDEIHNLDFHLIEFHGREILTIKNIFTDQIINFKEIPDGLYYYIISSGGKILAKNKIMKLK